MGTFVKASKHQGYEKSTMNQLERLLSVKRFCNGRTSGKAQRYRSCDHAETSSIFLDEQSETLSKGIRRTQIIAGIIASTFVRY